jgi:hypothetical protein
MKGLIIGAALALCTGGLAFAGPTLSISDGVTVNCGPSEPAGCFALGSEQEFSSSAYSVSGIFDGWDITAFGNSTGPTLVPGTVGLSLTSIVATCTGGVYSAANPGGCQNLNVALSDTFTSPAVEGFITGVLVASIAGTGASTTESSSVTDGSGTTTLFGPTASTSAASNTSLNAYSETSSSYSLGIEETFQACAGCSYSVTETLAGVPEQAGVELFGTVLLFGIGLCLRRKGLKQPV